MTRLEAPGIREDTGGMGYGSHPSKWYVISHLIRFFDHFILIFRDFRLFSHVMMHLEAPGIREDTAGVVYGSHPSKMVCDFAFISIFEYFILKFRDFRCFSCVKAIRVVSTPLHLFSM